MSNQIIASSLNKNFESIKKIDENGVEYWQARELLPILGYDKWQNAEEVVGRAARACVHSGQVVDNHFTKLSKMVRIGSNTVREVRDWKLDRYACYLIAQNGDPRKDEIAMAQTYFAIQTRRQELFENLSAADKRLFIRGEVTAENKKLFSTAKRAGVTKFGSFNDAGYKGLYGMPLVDIEHRKGIKKGELLDRAGTTELAANLFRITQTDEKIIKDNIRGDDLASRTHFMVGGKVRQTIKDIGGTTPENLLPEKHIKELKGAQKKLLGNKKEIGALIKWLPAERIVMAYEGEKAEAVCAVGYCLKGKIGFVTGSVLGKIVKIRGDNGFHWDCIFQPDGYDKTFAEMPREEKNKISHRHYAELKFKDIFKELVENNH